MPLRMLHPLRRGQADQRQRHADDVFAHAGEQQPRRARAHVVVEYAALIVELVERLGKIGGKARDHRGLGALEGALEDHRELLDEAHHFLRLGIGEGGKVRLCAFGGLRLRLAQHGAGAGVCVHDVGAGLAFKV